MTLSEYLRGSGISLCAFLPADVPPITKPRLLERVPQAKSVLFAAIPYYVGGEADANLAMFARPRDYHGYAAALTEDCRRILAQRHPGACAAGFADHSPYAEVRGAAMAGLGVIGDNGLLITEAYSSYVFIFELVTSLTPAEMAAEGIPAGGGEIRTCEHCGACGRACPGGCRGDERTRCLSAISQKKAALTEEEAELLRRAPHAWGCDVCQEICPHTARARAAGTLETPVIWFREERIPRLRTEDVTDMPEEAYAARAFGWRKKEIMLRNLRLRGE